MFQQACSETKQVGQSKTAARTPRLTQGRNIAAKLVVLGVTHLVQPGTAVKGGVDQKEPCMTQWSIMSIETDGAAALLPFSQLGWVREGGGLTAPSHVSWARNMRATNSLQHTACQRRCHSTRGAGERLAAEHPPDAQGVEVQLG